MHHHNLKKNSNRTVVVVAECWNGASEAGTMPLKGPCKKVISALMENSAVPLSMKA